MTRDFETLRAVMLYCEQRQVSPRATVVIDLPDEAADLALAGTELAESLNTLLELDYIDGPGATTGDLWLFRKLTRKGIEFVRVARDPEDWKSLKRRYAASGAPPS